MAALNTSFTGSAESGGSGAGGGGYGGPGGSRDDDDVRKAPVIYDNTQNVVTITGKRLGLWDTLVSYGQDAIDFFKTDDWSQASDAALASQSGSGNFGAYYEISQRMARGSFNGQSTPGKITFRQAITDSTITGPFKGAVNGLSKMSMSIINGSSERDIAKYLMREMNERPEIAYRQANEASARSWDGTILRYNSKYEELGGIPGEFLSPNAYGKVVHYGAKGGMSLLKYAAENDIRLKLGGTTVFDTTWGKSYIVPPGRGGANGTASTTESLTARESARRNLLNDPEELVDFIAGTSKESKNYAYYRKLESSKGPIEVKSKKTLVDEDARSIVIDEVHVFPVNDHKLKLGFREVKSLFQTLADELGTVGFEAVTIRGQRISGAKFVNNAPNKVQSITFIPRNPNQP